MQLLITLMTSLFGLLSPTWLQTMIDTGLNSIEDDIAKANNANKSGILLPLVAILRATINIPDTHKLAVPASGSIATQVNIVVTLISELFSLIPVASVKTMISNGLDSIEAKIINNPTEDALIMPIISIIRTTCSMPDLNPPKAAATSTTTTTTTTTTAAK